MATIGSRRPVCVAGPLSSHIADVRRWFSKRGYTQCSVDNRVGWTAQLGRWMESRGIQPKQLEERHLEAFVRFRRRGKSRLTVGTLGCVLTCLRELGVFPGGTAVVSSRPSRTDTAIAPFLTYLRQERALTPGVVEGYRRVVRSFLVSRFGENRRPRWNEITANQLSSFVVAQMRRFSSGTAKGSVTALRSFFRFLYVSGALRRDLTGALPAIAGWRLASLPKAIDPDQVGRLLSSPDRRTGIGKRDYAILLLLARLGLRCSEVTALHLEDIDWHGGKLLIHGKGKKIQHLPLSEEVGSSLAGYLRHGRTRSQSRSIFLGIRTPFQPLSSGALTDIVNRAASRAGIPTLSPHRLRHTVATQILRQGGSLDEIAQVLRHQSHDTTAIYAKVDLSALSSVAQPWPGGDL